MACSKYDSRQIAKMQRQLKSYLNGSLELGELIEDLIFLRNSLESCSDEWDRKFTDKLTDLESANSYLIDKELERPDEITKAVIDSAIPGLGKLIDSLK
ncbi:hypothetical protein KT71_18726 [Congregibacter litoralis KT71]|uniref:Uncharacterized protein n=1 Tax=Congregibacter litoralis KT71 TaxID=314285 RepID=A4ACT8_9GAMM|nr:hypothetical protein KT71_18726 [Congregibacter litoralis KT71]